MLAVYMHWNSSDIYFHHSVYACTHMYCKNWLANITTATNIEGNDSTLLKPVTNTLPIATDVL